MPPSIPQPTIYLRNKFLIKPGLQGRFFIGQRDLLKNLRPKGSAGLKLDLVAAFGAKALIEGKPAPEPLPPMMHIWKLPAWDSLYEAMYDFSETDWYTAEVQSLQSEHQDLLVAAGQGIEVTPRPAWRGPSDPGYVYVYEEIRLAPTTTKLGHLRDLNWLVAHVRDRDCHLQWIGGGITGVPAQICLLWRAPSFETIEQTLSEMAYKPEFAKRYADMMLGVQDISRSYMYPESTEYIDNEIPKAL
jgi:hypothetical protein